MVPEDIRMGALVVLSKRDPSFQGLSTDDGISLQY
jgi:hypothetical protein